MFRSRARSQRRIVFIKAQMRRDAAWQDVTIGNASEMGLMVKCAQPPRPGTEIELRRRGVTVAGKVIWASNTRFGMQAAEPINLQALAADSDLHARSAEARAVLERKGLWHWSSPRNP